MHHLVLLGSLLFAASSFQLSILQPTGVNGSHPLSNDTSSSIALNSTWFGAVFPPGYPGHDYIYDVPGSSLAIRCSRFQVQQELDSTVVYDLLTRAIRPFVNPAEKRFPAKGIRHARRGFHWFHEDEDESETIFVVELADTPVMDYGQMADTIIGMLQTAIDYPHLKMILSRIEVGDATAR